MINIIIYHFELEFSLNVRFVVALEQQVVFCLCVMQVCSEKYPGLVWDDEAKTMFRIPWKHAGKQDFRKDEDAAIFKVRMA